MRKTLVLFTFLLLSIGSWAQKTHDMSHEGSSGDVFVGYSLLNGDTLSHGSGWEAALTGNLNDWFGLKADLGGNYKSFGGVDGARVQHSVWAAALAPCGQVQRFSSTDCWALLMPALTSAPAAPARLGPWRRR